MNENEFGARVARALDTGLEEIEPRVLRQLASLREAAVARVGTAETVGSLSFVGIAGLGSLLRPSGFRRRMLWPALALVAGVLGTWYWQVVTAPAEGGEIELLADELPLDAYIDKGFDQWLRASSQH